MATQKITIAKLVGQAAHAVVRLFRGLAKPGQDCGETLDSFCMALRKHCSELPVVHFCEWTDHWLMGGDIFGPVQIGDNRFEAALHVAGPRFEASCMTAGEAREWAEACGTQSQEQTWLRSRLHEAVAAWESITADAVIVLIRETLGPSIEDEAIVAFASSVPEWFPKLARDEK